MKTSRLILTILLAVSCFIVGCKKGIAEDPAVDPASLQTSFASADANTKALVDQVVSSIKGGNYNDALTDLQTVYSAPGITPEQQKVVLGVKSFVMKKIAEAGKVINSQSK